jgi:hypothetical protein
VHAPALGDKAGVFSIHASAFWGMNTGRRGHWATAGVGERARLGLGNTGAKGAAEPILLSPRGLALACRMRGPNTGRHGHAHNGQPAAGQGWEAVPCGAGAHSRQ